MKPLLIIALFLITASIQAQFPVKGTWTNAVKHSNGSFVLASRLRIEDDQSMRRGQFSQLNFEHIRIIGNDWTYPHGINFGANGFVSWNSSTLYTYDAANLRHILAIPTGSRTYIRPGINRQVRETWYVLFAFYKVPFNNKVLPVAMRETSTFGTVSGSPQIQPVANALALWNSQSTVKRDSVEFKAEGNTDTGPNFRDFSGTVQPGNLIIEAIPHPRAQSLGSTNFPIISALDPTKSNLRIQFTAIETLTVDQENCNGRLVSGYNQSAEYVGLLETWMAINSSCTRPSGGMLGGTVINRPGNQGLNGILQLTMNQRFNLSHTKNYIIPNGQFQQARIVIGGNWSEVNPCTSLESNFSVKSVLVNASSCQAIMVKDLKLGDNTLDVGNNTDRIRLHFKVSQ
jgi:hypothetical protein